MDLSYAIVGITLTFSVLAILLAIFLLYGVVSFYYRPVTAFRWVIWVFVVETTLLITPSLPLGIQLFLPDLLFLLIFIAGLLRIFTLSLQREHYIWLLFGASLMLSFAVGTAKFGTTAGVEFRAFFYFWVGIWYFMVTPFSSSDADQITKSWMYASALLAADVIFRWIAMWLELDITRYWNEGGTSLRVFNAAQTYFLAQAFVISLYAYLNKTGPSWWKVLLPVLMICIVILQHRTVWIVTSVSIAILLLIAGRVRSTAVSTFLVAVLVGSAILLPFIVGGQFDPLQQSLSNSVTEVGKDNSTMAWRVQGWQTLLQQWAHGGLLVNLAGFPFGSGFARHIEASQLELTYSPHSQYVTVILRTGLIGILAMLVAYYMAISALRRSNEGTTPQLIDSKLLLALIAGQLLYFVTYSVQYVQFLPLGLSLAIVLQRRSIAMPDESLPTFRAPTAPSRHASIGGNGFFNDHQ